MNNREKIKQLKEEIEQNRLLIDLLKKKLEQQSQELLKAAKDKGSLSALWKKNSLLEMENDRLHESIKAYESQETKIVDIQHRQMEKRIQQLEMDKIKMSDELLTRTNKERKLEYELERIQENLVNIPSEASLVYEHNRTVENELAVVKNNYYRMINVIGHETIERRT